MHRKRLLASLKTDCLFVFLKKQLKKYSEGFSVSMGVSIRHPHTFENIVYLKNITDIYLQGLFQTQTVKYHHCDWKCRRTT